MAKRYTLRVAPSKVQRKSSGSGPLTSLRAISMGSRADEIWNYVEPLALQLAAMVENAPDDIGGDLETQLAALYGCMFWGKGDAVTFGHPDRVSYFRSLRNRHQDSIQLIYEPFVHGQLELILPWLGDHQDGRFRRLLSECEHVTDSDLDHSSIVLDFAHYLGYSLILPLSSTGHKRYIEDGADQHALVGHDLAGHRSEPNAIKLRSMAFEDIAVLWAAPQPLTNIRLPRNSTLTARNIEEIARSEVKKHIERAGRQEALLNRAGIPIQPRPPELDASFPIQHAINHIKRLLGTTVRDPECDKLRTSIFAETGRALGFKLLQQMKGKGLIPPHATLMDQGSAIPPPMATNLVASSAGDPKPRWEFPAEFLDTPDVQQWLDDHDR